MPRNLTGRNFVKLLDHTSEEIEHLLRLSHDLKTAKRTRTEHPVLTGKNIALIFEKTSTRTRCAFEVASYDQGAHVTYLGPSGTQIGHKESMKDTARVLGRMYDAIEYRGFGQSIVEELAAYAGVPVYNGLTDEFHPMQLLADVMTMQEHCSKKVADMKFCYLGDGRNNVANSLLVGGAKLGMDVRIAAPPTLQPEAWLVEQCEPVFSASGGRMTITDVVADAVAGCDFLYTDVWVSMGEAASKWEERIKLLQPFQINREVLAATGNSEARVLHCLPAFHNRETKVGQDIFEKFGLEAMEVTEDVFESKASVVFDQAENRVHTTKAVLVATLT